MKIKNNENSLDAEQIFELNKNSITYNNLEEFIRFE